jgi:hypothetical protein
VSWRRQVKRAAENRLKRVAVRARKALRQQPPIFYAGGGQAQVLGGTSQSAPLRSNRQPKLGQMGVGGPGLGVDYGTVAGPPEDIKPYEKVGRIKVLVRTILADGTIEFWVGGHIKKPIRIKTFSPGTLVLAHLENVGRGKKDWIFSYSSRVLPRLRLGIDPLTIGVMFGKRPQANWEITDKRCAYLRYMGEGFWAGKAYLNIDDSRPGGVANNPAHAYQSYSNINVPKPPIGQWHGTSYGRISGPLTYELRGGFISVEGRQGNSGDGIPTYFNDSIFANATNVLSSINYDRAMWDGVWEGGTEPPIPESYFIPSPSPEKCSIFMTWSLYRDGLLLRSTAQDINSNFFSFTLGLSAHNGAIVQIQGADTITFNRTASRDEEASDVIQTVDVLYPIYTAGGSDSCYLVNRTDNGVRRSVPEFQQANSRWDFSRVTLVPVAPEITVQESFEGFETHSLTSPPWVVENDGDSEATIISPRQTFTGGYLYTKEEGVGGSGLAYWRMPNPMIQHTEYIFSYQGEALTLAKIPQGVVKTIDKEPFPSFVVTPNTFYTIFEESDVATVKILRREENGFQDNESGEERKEKVRKIPIAETIRTVLMADYF